MRGSFPKFLSWVRFLCLSVVSLSFSHLWKAHLFTPGGRALWCRCISSPFEIMETCLKTISKPLIPTLWETEAGKSLQLEATPVLHSEFQDSQRKVLRPFLQKRKSLVIRIAECAVLLTPHWRFIPERPRYNSKSLQQHWGGRGRQVPLYSRPSWLTKRVSGYPGLV